MTFAPGAWRYALVPLALAPVAFVLAPLVSAGLIGLGLAVLAFFRDPERTPPPTGTVAPVDGNVSVLRTESGRTRLGVFMNVWHVHVARSPFDATVTAVEHVPGAHRPAFSKDSDRNERVHVTMELHDPDRLGVAGDPDDDGGVRAEVTFIAGAFARRIHPYVEPGDRLNRGQRIGHIAFGSRVDVLFPSDVDQDTLVVERGDSTRAGETVVVPAPTGPGANE